MGEVEQHEKISDDQMCVMAMPDGKACGVVAAVFEALQAFEQDGDDVAFGNAGDDSTHGFFPLF